jgi:hypothetical protein
MKQMLFNVVVFFQRLGIIKRLGLLIGALIFLFTIFIPDLKFNLQVKNPKKFPIEEIQASPKDNLPLYMVIDNAQVLKAGTAVSDSDLDSLLGGKIKALKESPLKLMSYSYNYVRQEKTKRGVTSLVSITYPVYSKNQTQKSQDAAQLPSFVVVKDAHITEKQLEGDAYFNDSTFVIKGQFSGSTIDQETLKLLKESGYNISPDAIILERGSTPMSLTMSLILTLLASLVSILGILALLPMNTLNKILGVQ